MISMNQFLLSLNERGEEKIRNPNKHYWFSIYMLSLIIAHEVTGAGTSGFNLLANTNKILETKEKRHARFYLIFPHGLKDSSFAMPQTMQNENGRFVKWSVSCETEVQQIEKCYQKWSRVTETKEHWHTNEVLRTCSERT